MSFHVWCDCMRVYDKAGATRNVSNGGSDVAVGVTTLFE